MRTLAVTQPSNQKFSHQKSGREASVFIGMRIPGVRSFPTVSPDSYMLQRQSGCACGGGCPRCQGNALLQTKLNVSEPEDESEQEANRMADWVINYPSEPPLPLPVTSSVATNGIQRVADEVSPTEEDAQQVEEEPEIATSTIQRMADAHSSTSQPADSIQSAENWQRNLEASRNRGQSLNPALQQLMENRFQADFSLVKIHTDSEADQLSQSIAARAFTQGSHIYFAAGEYRPETQVGQKLLAHELTHVLQQGRISGQSAMPTIRCMADLNQTTPSNLEQTNVAPWAPNRLEPRGNNYWVATDAGTRVKAWVAYGGYPTSHQYWCHGHSLGTYDRSFYSVYSGANNMGRVIADEWQAIPPASARVGDIAVFMPNFQHSARFVSPVVSGGILNESASRLSTKNGLYSLQIDTLSGILRVYPGTYNVFRRR